MTSFLSRTEQVLDKLLPFSEVKKFAKDKSRFFKATTIVKYFYFLYTFWLIFIFTGNIEESLKGQNFLPVWPLFWSQYINQEHLIPIVLLLFTATVLLGAFFYWSRIGRVLVFLGVLEFVGLQYSFGEGRTFEWWYPWLTTAFLFIFLPDVLNQRKISLERRVKFLTVFWGAQALFLLMYTMVGIHKLVYLSSLIFSGQVDVFSPDAFSRTMIYFITKYNLQRDSIIPLFAEFEYVGWLTQLGIIYIQLFAFWAAIKLSIQKIWAFLLILFHIGTNFVFDIIFLQMVLLLIVLFYDSPFLDPNLTFSKTIRQLPIFGWFLNFVKSTVNRSKPVCFRKYPALDPL